MKTKTVKKCVGKESFQRINYLYQLSNELTTKNLSKHIASLHYSSLAVNISKKAVQRLDIDVKRTLCKGCRSILIPSLTCKVRIKKKKVVKSCLKCGHVKIFDTRNKMYSTWSQNVESMVELLEYLSKETTHQSSNLPI